MKTRLGRRWLTVTLTVVLTTGLLIATGAFATTAVPLLWGVDETDGQLFSIGNYMDLSGFTDYGQLKYWDNGNLKNVGDEIESFDLTLAPNGIAYMVKNDNLGGTGEPVLLSFDLSTASTSSPNVATVEGSIVNLGQLDGTITGLAFDPSGDLLALFRDGGDSTVDKLLSIDLVSRVGNVVGNIQGSGEAAGKAEDMVFDSSGNLYVADDDDDHLYKVDPATGAIVAVVDSDLGGTVKVEALAWDWQYNALIGFDSKSEQFMNISLRDGGNSFIGGIAGLNDVEGMAFNQVPIPAAAYLLLSGLLGLIGIRRIRKGRS